MKKILIITAGLGNGHNSAAKGIVEEKKKENVKTIEVLDITKTTIMGRVMKFCFFNFSEKILEKIFDNTNTPKPKWSDKLFYSLFFPSLKKQIETTHYDEIICTFPCFPLCIPASYSGTITVQITDYISPHLSWIWGRFDCIRVLDMESKKYLSQYINSEKIEIVSFPLVNPAHQKRYIEKTEEIKKIEGREGQEEIEEVKQKKIVLFFHNILLGNEKEVIEKICKKYPSYRCVILAGRNYNYFIADTNIVLQVDILPWEEDIDSIYKSADIVGGKCGGAFISEVMQRNIPLIITGVFSGQEKGNYLYLQKYYKKNLLDI